MNCPKFAGRPYKSSLPSDIVMVLVDGKQRLEAIRRFYENELPVFGSFATEYTDRLLMHQSIKINMNDLSTRAEVVQWYIDLNSGGTPHTESEIEKAKALIR